MVPPLVPREPFTCGGSSRATTGVLVHTKESWEGTLPRRLSGRMQKALQESLDKALPHLKAEAERRASA